MKTKKKRTNAKLVIVALAAVAVLGMGAVTATTYAPKTNTDKFGGLGSAHEHAAFIVKLDEKIIDFSKDKYQVKSPFIHVENGVGTTLHKHALTVPFGEFLKSIGMNIENRCFMMDDGSKYCDDNRKMLRFYVNGVGQPSSSIMGYVMNDGDHFLIIYGDETTAELQQELARVQALPISSS